MFSAKHANLATRSVRYLEAGTGPAVLLLHAFPLNAEQWLPQLSKGVPGWRMIAPDLRGFGPVEPVGAVVGGASIDRHAADVVELMAHLDISTSVIVGLSMGGYVALAVFRHTPDRVRAVVLADTRAAADTDEARAGRERMLGVLERDGPGGVAREMIPKLLGTTTQREQPDLMDVVRHLIEANTVDGVAAGIRALRDRPDATSLLGDIRVSTLVICGEEDAITPPAEAEQLSGSIPGSTMAVIPGAGHLSNIEAPLAFSAALQTFLERRLRRSGLG